MEFPNHEQSLTIMDEIQAERERQRERQIALYGEGSAMQVLGLDNMVPRSSMIRSPECFKIL